MKDYFSMEQKEVNACEEPITYGLVFMLYTLTAVFWLPAYLIGKFACWLRGGE